MQPTLSRAEYWLLENVVDGLFPLCHLGEADFCPQRYVAGHGLDRAALIELLNQLFSARLIDASLDNDDATFTPTREQIASALDEPGPGKNERCMFYGLTEKGGAKWECFAFPEWRRYVADDPGELVGMQRELVEEYLRGLHFFGIQVQHGSESWDILHPWQATYWKTLQYGHRVTFQFTEDYDRYDSMVVPYRIKMLRRWYDWGKW